MRLKLSLLTGAVAFTIAGIAVAAQDKSFFSSTVGALSTISDLVSNSLWNTQPTGNVPRSAVDKHIAVTSPNNPLLHNITSSLSDHKFNSLPSLNFKVSEYNPINSGQSFADYGNAKQDITSGGNSGNNFEGGLGGGSNWGSVPGVSGNGEIPSIAPSTPEPGEWLLMLAGFGLVGYVAKRRKQNTAFV